MDKKLTPQQVNFCYAYVETGKPSEAAKQAGYSQKNASQAASRLLRKRNIQDLIATIQADAARKAQITAESVAADLVEIKDMAMGRKPKPMAMITKDGELIEREGRQADLAQANKANELLGRHIGMFGNENTQLDMTRGAMELFFQGIADKFSLDPPCVRGDKRGVLLEDGEIVE
jgi:phage terminase small subunit